MSQHFDNKHTQLKCTKVILMSLGLVVRRDLSYSKVAVYSPSILSISHHANDSQHKQ